MILEQQQHTTRYISEDLSESTRNIQKYQNCVNFRQNGSDCKI